MTRRSRRTRRKRSTGRVARTRSLRLLGVEDLIGSMIMTADGVRLGRVVDLLVAPAPSYRVRSLIFGKAAWLYRLHVLPPWAEKFGLRLHPRQIPWDAVRDFNGDAVTLKPGEWSVRDFELPKPASADEADS